MLEEIAKSIPIPEWAHYCSRYRRLYLNDLFLAGRFYDHIKFSFYDTEAAGGRFRKIFDRRPSIRLNIPMTTGDLVSRKLFAGRHVPRVLHEKAHVQEALQWLFREARLDQEFMEATFRGQSGSVAVTLKVVEGKPRVDVYNGRFCYPEFNDAKDLSRMVLCYEVAGSWWLQQGVRTDTDGDEIQPEAEYWYIRIFDEIGLFTTVPVKAEAWNPEAPPKAAVDLPIMATAPWVVLHNLGFTPVIWCRNLTGGECPDGRATFHGVLHNCIDLDYDCSQIGRGVKALVNPQIVVKGRLINYDQHSGGVHILDSNHMLHLEPDKRMGDQQVTGSDCKLLEMGGGGLDAAMSKYVERIKVFTLETMAANRKDPNTVKGTLSGKAIELIDEEFIDLVQVQRQSYGSYGLAICLKRLGLMCIRAAAGPAASQGLDKFKKVAEEDLDDIDLRWPELYEPDPQDTQFLSSALTNAIAGGLIAQPQAALIFDMHLDKSTDIFDLELEAGKLPPPVVTNIQPAEPGGGLAKQEERPATKRNSRKSE